MKIRMLTNTNYFGFRKEGEEIDVPEKVAQRWVKNGIAEIAEIAEIKLEDLSVKELYKLCIEKELEAEPKKSKEYYLEILNKMPDGHEAEEQTEE